MKVYITRHGQTEMNVRHLSSGNIETELTERGRMQAQELANRIKERNGECRIKRIFVSPLKRARDTASYVEKALSIKATVDQRLHEMSFGSMEAIDWDTPLFKELKFSPYMRFPGEGESILDVAHRAYSFMDDLLKEEDRSNVLIVCHGTFARILSTYFIEYTDEEYQEVSWQNCEVREFEIR